MSENRFSGKTYFYTIAYSAQKESGSNLSRTGTGRSSFGIILKDKFQKNPNVYFPTKEGVAGDKATSCSSEDGDEGGNGEGEIRRLVLKMTSKLNHENGETFGRAYFS